MAPERRLSAEDILAARAVNWPQSVTPVSRLMAPLLRTANLVLDATTHRVASHGLTFTEFEVLVTLRGAPRPHAMTPTALYGAVLMSSGGLTKVLHGLQKRRLVARGEGGSDRRVKPVRLTAKGRSLAERAMADVLRHDGERMSRGLSDSEVERLTRLLRRLLATLEPRSPASPAG